MDIRKPVDVATRETVAFLRAHVARGARVLEVGCGAGHVARALIDVGYDLVALDADAAEVQRARGLGVDAHCVAWPDFRGRPFDAIAFTRSLHHINPLDEALRRARELLRSGGVLLVEDFAFTETNHTTIDWLAGLLRSRPGRELLQSVPGEMVTMMLMEARGDAKGAWRACHDHELHEWGTMKEAIRRHFRAPDLPAVPYLYRYLIRVLPETARAASFVEAVLAKEAQLGERGDVMLIGRRMVAWPRPP